MQIEPVAADGANEGAGLGEQLRHAAFDRMEVEFAQPYPQRGLAIGVVGAGCVVDGGHVDARIVLVNAEAVEAHISRVVDIHAIEMVSALALEGVGLVGAEDVEAAVADLEAAVAVFGLQGVQAVAHKGMPAFAVLPIPLEAEGELPSALSSPQS